ncbi:hypothetical protein PSTT_16313 [Puccinia striiformis]|uniref:Uncharacterized protein n=1 Tax=Puccinia striiformis TaxID=27350 RepID=A0A2S4UDU9_9BASI|nr:hypothetical protein PSTT_16313 [Puccinia striiformis]
MASLDICKSQLFSGRKRPNETNLCSDKDSVYKVTGVLQLNGTVSRVDGQGHPTGNPDGICECQPTGINCNTRPSAPIFDGPPVFCANPVTNKCDAPAPQKLCSPAGSKYQVVGVIHPDGSVSSVDASGSVSPRASGICTCTPNGVPKCHLALPTPSSHHWSSVLIDKLTSVDREFVHMFFSLFRQ